MRAKVRKEDNQLMVILKEISDIAKGAKRIEEISESMSNIAFQTAFMTLDVIISEQEPSATGRLSGSVNEARQDLYDQFNLLLEEVAEIHHSITNKKKVLEICEKELN